MELARVDVVEPTPPATLDQAVAALKESIEDVGFEVTVRMAPSNRPAAQWTVSVEDLGMTCGSCVSTADRALRTVKCLSVRMCRYICWQSRSQIDFLEPTDRSTEEAVAILREAIDGVKSLVIVGGSVDRATATIRGVVLVAKLQPTEVASVRQVLTAGKGVREVRVSQARFEVSFERGALQLVSGADALALECARARREFEAVWWRVLFVVSLV